MFRKTVCILLTALILFGAGCAGNSVKKVDDGTALFRRDVSESADWQAYGAELVSCEVVKRQTNPSDKTDFVWLRVTGENEAVRIEAYYKLTYVLYNEGWLLEELIPDPKAETTLTKRQVACVCWGPDREYLAIVGEDGIVYDHRAASAGALPVIEGANVPSAVAGTRIDAADRAQAECLAALLRVIPKSTVLEYSRIDITDPSDIRLYYENIPYALQLGSPDQLNLSLERLQRNRLEINEQLAQYRDNGASFVTVFLYGQEGVTFSADYPAGVNDPTEVEEPMNEPIPEAPETPEATGPQTYSALLDRYNDQDGSDMVSITAVIPAYSTLTIVFPHQEPYQYENTEPNDMTRRVKIPVAVFYPNEPLSDPVVLITPEITVTYAEGSSFRVDCPAFSVTFPELSLTVDAPLPNGFGIRMADESGLVRIWGTVNDPQAEVTVNDVVLPLYEGGVYLYEYQFEEGTEIDASETFRIVARKNNFVTAETVIEVYPYQFIPGSVTLQLPTENAPLYADAAGKATVTGKTDPGATLTATSGDPENVLCGAVSVDGEGNFRFQIVTEPEYQGGCFITLTGEKEGLEPSVRKFCFVKGFKDKSDFLKYFNKEPRRYIEMKPNEPSAAELLANQAEYTSGCGFRIVATVNQVIEFEDGDTVVKMTLHKTNETVCVHNLSRVWNPANNIGVRYYVYCTFLGEYETEGCCEFLGWFAKATP